MTKQYISDIITEEEIKKWQKGNRILISSQTGSGKSEFIKNNLYNYCKATHQKILLMSNRNLLKNQNLEEIKGKTHSIKAHNYQEFEYLVSQGVNTTELFQPYDYIVFDESHYFFADSAFNKNTDLLIEPIKNTPPDKIFIFITATPQALLEYQDAYDFRYTLPYDYSYIENVYFYTPVNSMAAIKSIIRNIPENEKVLCFGSNTKDVWELSMEFDSSSFICSPYNPFERHIHKDTIREIVQQECFESKTLFSTKFLDNGVNLKDSSLKHIVIDMLDPISFVQCLGRKRAVSSDDKINLYVRNYHRGNIYYVLQSIRDHLEFVKDASMLDFESLISKYPKKKSEDLLTAKYEWNTAKYHHYLTQKNMLEDMLRNPSKSTYKEYVCNLISYDIAKVTDANGKIERHNLDTLLEHYAGIKMFKEEQSIFKKQFFESIFTPKKTDYKSCGIKAANGVIEEDGLNYTVHSRQESKGEMRNRSYWIVEKKVK